jgi:hypothetical protein
MVRQAGKVAEMMGKPAVLLLDAYFFSKTTLLNRLTAAGYIGANGRVLLDVIVRAKQRAAACLEPEQETGKRRGGKRVYGKKVTLKTLFKDTLINLTLRHGCGNRVTLRSKLVSLRK